MKKTIYMCDKCGKEFIPINISIPFVSMDDAIAYIDINKMVCEGYCFCTNCVLSAIRDYIDSRGEV